MWVEEQAVEDGVVLRLSGRLTGEVADLLEAAVVGAAACRPGRIVIDLTGVSMVDAGGLGALINAYQASAAALIPLGLARVPQRARELLAVTRLTSVFPIAESVEEAFGAAVRGPRGAPPSGSRDSGSTTDPVQVVTAATAPRCNGATLRPRAGFCAVHEPVALALGGLGGKSS
jgi:anti-anti-sigma factor